ncbi:unnamed protein product, partial [Iphiclides podalirius]
MGNFRGNAAVVSRLRADLLIETWTRRAVRRRAGRFVGFRPINYELKGLNRRPHAAIAAGGLGRSLTNGINERTFA